jgi:hypothetical protein
MYRACTLLSLLMIRAAGMENPNVTEIVQRSVENTNADWAVAPQYSFTERDIITRNGRQTVKTYQVVMLSGSPYNKLLSSDGHKLSPDQAAAEESKLQHEIVRRQKETPGARQKRLEEYQNERRQDHALMQEMVKGFSFKLLRQEAMNGRRCFVLGATPRPGYEPTSRDTKVLKGMRGTMWVDTKQYRWVKVYAEVFRPVEFGLFIARVQPGTEFTLEEMPVEGNVWLPSHFSTRVRAKILLFSRQSLDDETYSNYRRIGKAEVNGPSR